MYPVVVTTFAELQGLLDAGAKHILVRGWLRGDKLLQMRPGVVLQGLPGNCIECPGIVMEANTKLDGLNMRAPDWIGTVRLPVGEYLARAMGGFMLLFPYVEPKGQQPAPAPSDLGSNVFPFKRPGVG